jgi:hypothetical protein
MGTPQMYGAGQVHTCGGSPQQMGSSGNRGSGPRRYRGRKLELAGCGGTHNDPCERTAMSGHVRHPDRQPRREVLFE